MMRVGMMTEMSQLRNGWGQVNQDENGEANGMNLEVDSKDEMMHI